MQNDVDHKEDREQALQIKQRLDSIQSLIEDGNEKNENLMKMQQKLRGIQLMIEQSSDDYRKDYEQLLQILNQNQLQTNDGFSLYTKQSKQDVFIKQLQADIIDFKQIEGKLIEEINQLKIEKSALIEKYFMMKRILLFLVIFGGVWCFYYVKKKGSHLKFIKSIK